jgi:hypothetical protein
MLFVQAEDSDGAIVGDPEGASLSWTVGVIRKGPFS